MGGLFVNYFNRFGRQWQVYVEAEAPYRSKLDDFGQFYVRSSHGDMVPLSSLTRFETRSGPEFTMRYNEYRATGKRRGERLLCAPRPGPAASNRPGHR